MDHEDGKPGPGVGTHYGSGAARKLCPKGRPAGVVATDLWLAEGPLLPKQ